MLAEGKTGLISGRTRKGRLNAGAAAGRDSALSRAARSVANSRVLNRHGSLGDTGQRQRPGARRRDGSEPRGDR